MRQTPLALTLTLICFVWTLPMVSAGQQDCGDQCEVAASQFPTLNRGPGTEMTKIINRLGFGSNCQRCQALANEMDYRGANWIEQNFDSVVARTIENARRLGHPMGPVKQAGVRMIVRHAIRKSRRTPILPRQSK